MTERWDPTKDPRFERRRESVPESLSDLERLGRPAFGRQIGPLRVFLGMGLCAATVLAAWFVFARTTAPWADSVPLLQGVPAGATALSQSGSGAVWIGHPHSGITRIDPRFFLTKRFTRFSTEGGLVSDSVLDVSVAGEALLALADPERRSLCVRLPTGDWVRPIAGGRLPGLDEHSVVAAGARESILFLLLANGGLGTYDRSDRRLSPVSFQPPLTGRVESFAVDRSKTPVLLAGGRMYALTRKGSQWFRVPIDLGDGHDPAGLETGPRSVLVRTRGGALLGVDVPHRRYRSVVAGETFPDLDLKSVAWAATDPDGRGLWLLQKSGALGHYVFDSGVWSHLRLPGRPSDRAAPVLHDKQQEIAVPLEKKGVVWCRKVGETLRLVGHAMRDNEILGIEEAGEELLITARKDGRRVVAALSWTDTDSMRVIRDTQRVPSRSGPWIDTLAYADESTLCFATRGGDLRVYDIARRSFVPGQVWRLESEEPLVAVRGAGDQLFAVGEKGTLRKAPHWNSPGIRTARLSSRVMVGVGRFPLVEPAHFAALGDEILVFFADGSVYSYSLDRGIRRETFRAGDDQTRGDRKTARGGEVSRQETGGPEPERKGRRDAVPEAAERSRKGAIDIRPDQVRRVGGAVFGVDSTGRVLRCRQAGE